MADISISIIIPSRNRETILWVTVDKALAAIGNYAAEIIIVNDGDNDLIISETHHKKVKVYNNPKTGVSTARNFAASKAKGNILFFIDDDMWLVPEVFSWIQTNLQSAIHTDAVYNISWQYPPTLNHQLQHSKVGCFLLDNNYNTMWGRMHQPGKQPEKGLYPFHAVASGSLLMHAEVFKKINGYNEDLVFQGEDIDMSKRLKELSIPIYVVFEVSLYHNHKDRLEIEGFLQRLQSGYLSEFKAREKGIIKDNERVSYAGAPRLLFEFFRITEPAWVFLHKALPNQSWLRGFNNKLIGTLAGLQRYKQWCKTLGK